MDIKFCIFLSQMSHETLFGSNLKKYGKGEGGRSGEDILFPLFVVSAEWREQELL